MMLQLLGSWHKHICAIAVWLCSPLTGSAVIVTLLCEARVLQQWLPLVPNGRNQTDSRRTPGAWRITRGGGIMAPVCAGSKRMARVCACVFRSKEKGGEAIDSLLFDSEAEGWWTPVIKRYRTKAYLEESGGHRPTWHAISGWQVAQNRARSCCCTLRRDSGHSVGVLLQMFNCIKATNQDVVEM